MTEATAAELERLRAKWALALYPPPGAEMEATIKFKARRAGRKGYALMSRKAPAKRAGKAAVAPSTGAGVG